MGEKWKMENGSWKMEGGEEAWERRLDFKSYGREVEDGKWQLENGRRGEIIGFLNLMGSDLKEGKKHGREDWISNRMGGKWQMENGRRGEIIGFLNLMGSDLKEGKKHGR